MRLCPRGRGGEVDEPSDTSRMDSAELSDTDGQLDSDVWDDMDRPVWMYGSRMVDNLSQASRHLSNNRDVACMGDFVDEDLMTMDLIRMWTPGWSSNGMDGMMHIQGNPKYPTGLGYGFSGKVAKEVLCYQG